MKVKITLTNEMLGTKSDDPEVFGTYIASKCEDDDLRKQELQVAENIEKRGTSVFHRHPETGELIIWDYMVKGFLKAAGDSIRVASNNKKASDDEEKPKPGRTKKWGSIKSKIDQFVRVRPRMIPLGKTDPDGVCERSLRVNTAQGPRVTVARSEVVNEKTSFEVEIDVYSGAPITEDMLTQILDFGGWTGLGQWRNAGKGQFTWEEIA